MKMSMSESVCLALEGARMLFSQLIGEGLPFQMYQLEISDADSRTYNNRDIRVVVVKAFIMTPSAVQYHDANATVSVLKDKGMWCFAFDEHPHYASLGKGHAVYTFHWKRGRPNQFYGPVLADCQPSGVKPPRSLAAEILGY